MSAGRAWCAIDLRSLAFFRIALGLLVLVDLALRLGDWRAFYAEEGLWPRAASIRDWQGEGWAWSVHWLSASVVWLWTLFALHAVAGLALLIGWQTRLANVVAWVLIASLHTRNAMVIDGGDMELRLLLFWSMWLPLGARWSVDARGDSSPGAVVSVASAALLGQVALLYITSALWKHDPVWWRTGEAGREALHLEAFALPLAATVREWDGLLRLGTFATLLLEFFGPVMAFVFWRRMWVRHGVVLAFAGMHLSLGLLLDLGLLAWVGIAGWIPFWAWAGGTPEDTGGTPMLRGEGRVAWVLVALFGLAALSAVQPLVPRLIPEAVKQAAVLLRLDQRWSHFAPRPATDEGWYVVVATDAAGREIDLLTGAAPVWTEPRPLIAKFSNPRWRKLSTRLLEPGHGERLREYAAWLRRRHGAPLKEVRLWWVTVSIYDRTPKRLEVYAWPERLNFAR